MGVQLSDRVENIVGKGEIEPGTPAQKANTITTELKRILCNTVVRYSI